ncbi:hypothetical protein Pcinc_010009 [Petrolisthes cinctipes]|uniref:C2H2-type domain-containing protein n=1 Tax=Petrolisthes cinctipes TaxID=88211 RepID=A0AAE1G5S0_PETCI|nr:hypothetical protein Pcinc_010009 [Petrolisthes cinctipes]
MSEAPCRAGGYTGSWGQAMSSMYGPSRSHYGGYGNYWGGYGHPPHPPPPPPIPPHDPQASFQPPPPPPPPPPHFRHMRPPPHAFRPPPPPPPIRLPRPQQQSQPPYPPQQSNPRQTRSQTPSQDTRKTTGTSQQTNFNNIRTQSNTCLVHGAKTPQPPPPPPPEVNNVGEATSQGKQGEQKQNNHKPPEPQTGSPLVPRRKEPDSPPQPATPTKTPNNKRPLPVEFDPNLPDDLVSKFHNNACELCDVKLNSRIQAKNHYEGKQHTKKVRNYLIENSQKDGQPAAKLPKIDLSTPKKKVEPLDVSQLYCKCCELSFTSEQHAQQHYLGRNHQRVLHGLKPLRAGYFNKETGKWQRMPPDPRVAAERLGAQTPVEGSEATEGEGETTKKPPLDPDAVKERGRFFCELCNVSATSQDQLDGHMSGQRHLKAVRLSLRNSSSPAAPATQSGMCTFLYSILNV